MKQSGLYRIEDINNPNICTIVVNSKEYSGKFKIDQSIKNIKV